MFKRSALIIAAVYVLACAGVSGADLIEPGFFSRTLKRSAPSESASAAITLSASGYFGEEDSVSLEITPRASGKYSYALIDTRDDSIVQEREASLDDVENDPWFSRGRGMAMRLAAGVPAEGQRLRYMVTARYGPYDKDRWETVSFTEYFTVRSRNGKPIFE